MVKRVRWKGGDILRMVPNQNLVTQVGIDGQLQISGGLRGIWAELMDEVQPFRWLNCIFQIWTSLI
jgi:hypothetical protein